MHRNTVERRIMWGDLDPLGIVFYPRYYEWIDGCAHLFFESVDLSPDRMWTDRNIIFGLVETGCRYFSPGRYHETIRIVTEIERLEKKTVTLGHRITGQASGTLMVAAREHRICMDVSDPKNLKARAIPDDIHRIFSEAMEK